MSEAAPLSVERAAVVTAMLDRLDQLDSETVMGSLPEALRSRLAGQRFASRLALRHGRRHAGDALFAAPVDDAEQHLTRAGALETLVARAGAHVMWRDVLRVVRRDALDALEAEIGTDPRSASARGKVKNLGIEPTMETESLADAIWAEGALCWGCWLAGGDPSSARRLRALTPRRIAVLVPATPLAHADERRGRRAVIDAELADLLSPTEEE